MNKNKLSSIVRATDARFDVIERRIRPIYQFLDNGNPKKALQEIDRLLSKSKGAQHPVLSSLRCLVLHRSGRQEEAVKLADTIKQTVCADENALSILSEYYRESNRFDDIVSLYERACELYPNDEELLCTLFMSLIPTCDFCRQKQVAANLYQITQKVSYLLWMVLLIFLQAHEKPSVDESTEILLRLAERLVAKAGSEGLSLHLMICEAQKNYEKMLSLLNSVEAKNLPFNYCLEKKLLCLKHLNQFQALFELIEDKLDKNLDNWMLFKIFIDVSIETNNVNHAEGFIARLLSSNPCRSVELSEVYLKCRMQHPLAESAIIKYFNSYSITCNCFHEIIEVASFLPAERKKQLSSYFYHLLFHFNWSTFNHHQSVYNCQTIVFVAYILNPLKFIQADQTKKCTNVGDGGNLIQGLSNLNLDEKNNNDVECIDGADISWPFFTVAYQNEFHGLKRHCKGEFDVSELNNIKNIVSVYKRFAPKFAVNLFPTDFNPLDFILILCADAIVNVSWTLTLEAVCIMEELILRSPSDHYAFLILARLYSFCGAFAKVISIFNSLHVKNVQLHSLGYIIVENALRFGIWNTSKNIITSQIQFFATNRSEIFSSLVVSFRNGILTEIPSLIHFGRNINNSLVYVCALVVDSVLDLLLFDDFTMPVIPPVLEDNRDFEPLKIFCPTCHSLDDQKSHSFYETELLLKFRFSTLELISSYNDNIASKLEDIITSIENFTFTPFCLHGPYCSGLQSMSKLDLPKVVLGHVRLLRAFHGEDLSNIFDEIERCFAYCESFHIQTEGKDVVELGLLLESISCSVEMFSYCVHFMRQCSHKLTVLRSDVKKRKKKGNVSCDEIELFGQITNQFRRLCEKLLDILNLISVCALSHFRNAPQYSKCFLTNNVSLMDELLKDISHSYCESVADITCVIQRKRNLLNSLLS